MDQILKKLRGGDLRSIGKADEVVEDIIKNPRLFGEVFKGMLDDDPIVRMRSADALEKVSSIHPEYLQPFRGKLINEVSKIEQQEVRWHVAQMFSYLDLSKDERDKVIEILLSFIDTNKSKIVKVFSITTLANIAEKDQNRKSFILKKLQEFIQSDSPAIISRTKKLIKKLEK